MIVRPPLQVDKLYRDTADWHNQYDEFNKMFHHFPDNKGVRNMGGFRAKCKSCGTVSALESTAFVILVTTFDEPEWPDTYDEETGVFTYYGDKRSPGDLHDTPLRGNLLLSETFDKLHSTMRSMIPPFLCFEKVRNSEGSHMRFIGLAAPGAIGVPEREDLVAVWRRKGVRFQNYKSVFTILDTNNVPWDWLDDLVRGLTPADSNHCPICWSTWVKNGKIHALKCRNDFLRSKLEQLPEDKLGKEILSVIQGVSNRDFEYVSRAILYLLDQSFSELELTPPVRDGGRDIIGYFSVGGYPCSARLTVYAEAKKWKNSVGVKPVARLISRLRHRDLGVFITTSWYDRQVQQELHDDRHPVILVSGRDIVRILRENDVTDTTCLRVWLESVCTNSGKE